MVNGPLVKNTSNVQPTIDEYNAASEICVLNKITTCREPADSNPWIRVVKFDFTGSGCLQLVHGYNGSDVTSCSSGTGSKVEHAIPAPGIITKIASSKWRNGLIGFSITYLNGSTKLSETKDFGDMATATDTPLTEQNGPIRGIVRGFKIHRQNAAAEIKKF